MLPTQAIAAQVPAEQSIHREHDLVILGGAGLGPLLRQVAAVGKIAEGAPVRTVGKAQQVVEPLSEQPVIVSEIAFL